MSAPKDPIMNQEREADIIAAEAVRQWNAAGNAHLSTRAIGVARIAAELALRSGGEGWQLVPVEPTEAMQRASRIVINLAPGSRITTWGANVWAEMLAAAPPPPSIQGEG